MASQDLDLLKPQYQGPIRSKIIRTSFTDIQNNFNALRSEVQNTLSSTASEVTSARDGFASLQDNIHIRRIGDVDGVATGGIVTAQGTPDNTVRVSAGNGAVQGVGVNWTSATSATVAAVGTARKNVVVINSDNSVGIELGSTATSVLPTITNTQRPLSIISQSTASPAVFNSSDLTDARGQGCFIKERKEWYFKIQDAINALGNTTSGEIIIGKGNYYEDLTLKNNQTLRFDTGVNLYTSNGTALEYKDINVKGVDNVRIITAAGDKNTYDRKISCWGQYGIAYDVSGGGSIANPNLAGLSETRFAILDSGGLSTHDFNGHQWSQTGNEKTGIAGAKNALTALSSTRVALINATDDNLEAYDFDGTDWAIVGNSKSITGVATDLALTALSSTRVAFVDIGNGELRAYDFDGTDWTLQGSGLSISGMSAVVSLAAMSSTRVAFFGNGNSDLRVYDFDGSNWTQTGNDLNISTGLYSSLTALSGNEVVLSNHTVISTYRFDGTDWSLSGALYTIPSPSGGDQDVTALTSNIILKADSGTDDVVGYIASRTLELSSVPPSPAF
jgi:hypothetical protein